jgi:hypothetical protein
MAPNRHRIGAVTLVVCVARRPALPYCRISYSVGLQHTHEDSMIGNCMRAFALSTAFAIISSASPAIAGGFDGNWNMVAVTTSGHCGNIPIGLGISRSQIYSTSGKFAFHRIQLAGRISASGQARINAVAGPRVAHGTGRFNRSRGSGTWAGTGPSGLCSGVWSATRS